MRLFSVLILVLQSSAVLAQDIAAPEVFTDQALSRRLPLHSNELGNTGPFTVAPAPSEGVGQFVDPGQQLFNMEIRGRYGLGQTTPSWAEFARTSEEAWLSQPQVQMPDGRWTLAPVFDPKTSTYLSPYGSPVDMQDLFKEQGAMLFNLSVKERETFDDLLQRFDTLSPEERAQFDNLYKKGAVLPYPGPPTPLPFTPGPDVPFIQPIIVQKNICPNGKVLPPLCAYVDGPKRPEYCKCD